MGAMSTESHVVHLTAERFEALVRAAADQGKSPDELADEAIAALLRRRRLDELIDFGRRHAQHQGIDEGEVERLIAEARSERRNRTGSVRGTPR